MKFIVVSLLLLCAANANAQKVMECDHYKVDENKKQDRTVFRLTLSPDESSIAYTKVSGREWFLPSDSLLRPIWVSNDGLRVVAYWIAKDYGVDKARWSPVYVLDIDFAAPNFREESYGGFADFSEIVYSPWKHECKRLD